MKPTIKSLTEQLDKVTCEKNYIIEQQLKRIRHLEGSPKVQEQLKAAHDRITELVYENKQLKIGKDIADNGLMECAKELAKYAEQNAKLIESNDLHIAENEELQERYNKLFEEAKNVNAENHALKSEIERTNRHINLAENALHEKEQQPLVVNHYHNCTINK